MKVVETQTSPDPIHNGGAHIMLLLVLIVTVMVSSMPVTHCSLQQSFPYKVVAADERVPRSLSARRCRGSGRGRCLLSPPCSFAATANGRVLMYDLVNRCAPSGPNFVKVGPPCKPSPFQFILWQLLTHIIRSLGVAMLLPEAMPLPENGGPPFSEGGMDHVPSCAAGAHESFARGINITLIALFSRA